MSTLIWGDESAPGPVRAGVIAASLAVAACFGLSIGLSSQPVQASEPPVEAQAQP